MPEDYGWTQRYARPEDLRASGLGHLVDVPFIRDSKLNYAELPNRFLIDLALGIWDARNRGKRQAPFRVAKETLRSTAYWLTNALEWADSRSIDLMHCDYVAVLVGRYQREMQAGIWSANGQPLKPATINARIGAVLLYQQWAADKGLRSPIEMPTVTTTFLAPSHGNSRSHETTTVEARQGKLRVAPGTLVFPSELDIHEWRKRVHLHPTHGQTEGLLIDLILDTAIRREEASCWRVDTLPLDRAKWKVINPDEAPEYQSVMVTLRYGTKGKEYGRNFGDKIGPEGHIKLPLRLAERIDAYRQKVRPKALAVAVRRGKSVAQQMRIRDDAVHLFLNPETGIRYTGKQIYSVWTSVNHPDHWSPHAARHYWACCHLERRMKDQAELMAKILALPGLTHNSPLLLGLRDTATSIIQLEIMPQLRHSSSRTTELYLRWYFNRSGIPYQPRANWRSETEGMESES